MRLTCSMAGPHSHSASVPADARGECPCRFSASRRARTAISISATRCRRSSTSTWRVPPAEGFCCASRTSTRPAAGPSSMRRSTRIWHGWGSLGRSRCGASPSISPPTRPRARGLFYATCESRAEIARLVAEREVQGAWPRDPDGAPLYPGSAHAMPAAERAARIAAGEAFVLRLDMAAARAAAGPLTWHETGEGPGGESGTVAAAPEIWGDVVLARRDTPTSYHVSVVLDDADQGVTHVVRGQDLFWSTSIHRLLQVLLGLPVPTYRHHHLVLDQDGRKLSKSTRATGLRELRQQGATPADIRRLIGLG